MNIDDVLNPPVDAQVKAMLLACEALASAIQALGEVPSGELYARVMGHMSLATYTSIVNTLKRAKLVEERSHLLRWIGPEAKR